MRKLLLVVIPFLLLQCGEKTQSISEKKAFPSELYVIAKNGLILREQPSQTSKSIMLIPFSTKVSIMEVSDKTEKINSMNASWYKIKWDAKEGWAFGGFLKEIVAYPEKILMTPTLNISSLIPENILNSENRPKLKIEDLNSVPDIMFDSELIVIDQNEVYNDSIGEIYFDPNPDSSDILFKLKSGKKFKEGNIPVFFRKSYYNSLSKTLPNLVKVKSIANTDLSEQIYKAIGKNESAWLVHGTTENKDNEAIARKDFNLKIYDLSVNENKNYLATLQNKKKEEWFYNTFIFMNNDKIIFIENGNFINSFTINNELYLLFDTWLPESQSFSRSIYINNNGLIKKVIPDNV